MNRLNSSMHGKGKLVLDVSKTSSRLKVKSVLDPSNWKWKNICVFSIKRISRKGRNWFPLDSSSLSWAPNYISLRWINIPFSQLHQKHAKHFWGARATDLLWSGLHCWTVDWAAKSTAVESDSILSGCPDNGTKSLWSVSAGNKSSCFFQLHTPVKLFFNNITTFKTKHGYQLQPEDDIRWCALKTTSPCFVKLVKQTETRFSLKFVNVGDEQKFPKTSVWIILVDLVYLESAKICTGLKIVRGLKRLRTTASDYSLCSRSVKFLKRRCFSNQGSAA